jgi:RES domain
VRHVQRGGVYLRVANPGWDDPLSGEHSLRNGGRWNPPGSFGVVYLNASREVARAQVRHKLEPRGVRPEDLDPSAAPVLVRTKVPDDRYVDAVTDRGLASLGLPEGYPLGADGNIVPHGVCRPIGRRAREAEEHGIACRSAARTAPPGGEELAYFGPRRLRAEGEERFVDWYWSDR